MEMPPRPSTSMIKSASNNNKITTKMKAQDDEQETTRAAKRKLPIPAKRVKSGNNTPSEEFGAEEKDKVELNNSGSLPPHEDWTEFASVLSILLNIQDFTLQLLESQHQEQEILAKGMAHPLLRPTDHSFGLDPEKKTFSSYFNRQGGRNNLRRIFVDGAAIFDNGPNVANYWTGRSPNDVLRTDHLLRVLLELVVRGHFVIVLMPSSFRCGRMTTDDPGLLCELENLAILKYCGVSYWKELFDAHTGEDDDPHAPLLLAPHSTLKAADIMGQPFVVKGVKHSCVDTSIRFLSAKFIGRRAPALVMVVGTHNYKKLFTLKAVLGYDNRDEAQMRRVYGNKYVRKEHEAKMLDAQLQVGTQLKLLAILCTRLKPAELPLQARRQLDVVRRVADRLYRRHIERLDEHDSDDDDDGWGPTPSDPLPVLEATAALQNAVLDDDEWGWEN